jgi:hypothetical protein
MQSAYKTFMAVNFPCYYLVLLSLELQNLIMYLILQHIDLNVLFRKDRMLNNV